MYGVRSTWAWPTSSSSTRAESETIARRRLDVLQESGPLGVAVDRRLGAEPPALLDHGDEQVDDRIHLFGPGPADPDPPHGVPSTAPRTRRLSAHGVTPETAAGTR